MSAEAIREALAKSATRVVETAPQAWSLTLSNGFDLSVDARCEDGWLLLRSPLAAAIARHDGGRLLGSLHANSLLPGNARIAVTPTGSVAACAEVALEADDEDEDLAACTLDTALDGLRQAAAVYWKGSVPALVGTGTPEHERLATLCTEAGWSCSPRPGIGVAVNLEVDGGLRQATVSCRADGTLRVATDLQLVPYCAAEQQRAVALFLLHAAGMMRCARPTAEIGSIGLRGAIESIVAPQAAPSAVGCALAAVSVAAEWFAAEAEALTRSPALADAFSSLHEHSKP